MRPKHLVVIGCALLVLALSTAPAEALRRHRGHVTIIRHSPLLWGGGFYGGFYRPHYFGFSQWYPQPYPVFGFPPGVYQMDNAVALRVQSLDDVPPYQTSPTHDDDVHACLVVGCRWRVGEFVSRLMFRC